MVAAGDSFVTHDPEDYITQEMCICFNGILGSREVGKTYRDPYSMYFFLI
jgi:hypothetical protein